MTRSLFLIDTSALFRIFTRPYRDDWADHLTSGVIATCPVVELEFLFSARSLSDRMEKQRTLRHLLSWVPMNERAFERAAGVQLQLTEKGTHRSAGAVDLLIAATAEREGLTLLTADKDFVAVAAVTGQPVRLIGV